MKEIQEIKFFIWYLRHACWKLWIFLKVSVQPRSVNQYTQNSQKYKCAQNRLLSAYFKESEETSISSRWQISPFFAFSELFPPSLWSQRQCSTANWKYNPWGLTREWILKMNVWFIAKWFKLHVDQTLHSMQHYYLLFIIYCSQLL